MKSKNKKIYRDFCESENDLSIFYKDWWLDTVCEPQNWDIAYVLNNNDIVAAMPYYYKRNNWLSMPPFTQSLGPYIKKKSEMKYTNMIGNEIKLMDELINQLPKFSFFSQRFNYSLQNWLPFYWSNFKQTTRYTYIIEDLTDLDSIYSGFKENVRRNIKKAEKKHLTVIESDDINKLSDILVQNKIIKSKDVTILNKVYKKCKDKNCGKLFAVIDDKQDIHAMAFIIWDKDQAYYLAGGSDLKYKNSVASTLLLWESIRFAAKVTNSFNFEGSMIKTIERFFRSFGAKQQPYFHVFKYNNLFIRFYIGVFGIFNKRLF